MASGNQQDKRPLSPHLQIYKPQMTTVMSIFHRFTGIALAIGTVMVAWLLIAAATGQEAYDCFTTFATHPLGHLMLFGWSVALFYHMFNGIRHLFWDMGYLFKIQNATRAGIVVLLATFIATVLLWTKVWGIYP